MKPDPNTRATTKDILRHEWLVNGPILSISRLSSSLATTTSSTDYETVKLRTITPVETPTSPNNSLAELELHSSSFYDARRLRDHSDHRQQQRRHRRASAIPISVRYLSTNPSSSSTGTRPTYHRRPVSLAFDDQRTPTTTTTLADRFSLTLTPSDSTPTGRFPLSSDYEFMSEDTPRSSPPSTKLAPSVFTTSAIKFAPVPSIQRLQENSSARLETNSDNHTNTASNSTNRHTLLTSLELPSTYINRLLDDNNNLLSLKVYE